MSTTKIPTKPSINPEKVSRARDMSGLQKWSQNSRLVGFVMLFLGWFTIPAEVFLRRNFGRRWFTATNFLTGSVLLIAVAFFQYTGDKISYFFTHFNAVWNPFYTEDYSYQYYSGVVEMGTIFLFYAVMGTAHLLKIWWRNRVGSELHSYDDGTSWLEGPGRIVCVIINLLAVPLIYLYSLSRSQEEQEKAKELPKLIKDSSVFTNTVFEPFFFLCFADYYYDAYSIITLWLFITAFAVAVHANQKENVRRNKILDIQDAALEAKAMKELRKKNTTPQTESQKPKSQVQVQQMPVPAPVSYPDVMTIIEEMHWERNRRLSELVKALR